MDLDEEARKKRRQNILATLLAIAVMLQLALFLYQQHHRH